MLCNLYWVNNICIGSLTLSNRGKKCFAAPLRGATAPAGPPGFATAHILIANNHASAGSFRKRSTSHFAAGLVLSYYSFAF